MNLVRRTFDLDSETDARLRELATERGQDVSAVLAEAVALFDFVIDIGNPDIAKDRRRLQQFRHAREAVPLHEIKSGVESWGTEPGPKPQRMS
jgi:predicted transcriptional regulator